MHVVIKEISQGLSLETGASYSFMVLMLPDGKLIRAEVDDEALAQVTQLFMSSGSSAANAAAAGVRQTGTQHQQVSANEFDESGEPEQLVRNFSPLTIQEEIDGEMVSTFGGNFTGTDLDGVGEALAKAEASMARAIGDTTGASPAEVRSVVEAIKNAPPPMPVPNVMRQQTKPRLTVEADAKGNPLIKGAGLVDPRAITGGNTEGEEDAGQV